MSQLDDLIARCEDSIKTGEKYAKDPEERKERKDIYRVYRDCYAREVYELTSNYVDADTMNQITLDIIDTVYRQLNALKEKREHELAVAQANAGHFNVSSVSEASAMASASATFNNTMSQMWALPVDMLSSEQKQELAKLIQNVEDAKGNESKLKKAGKALANWLFDQGIKAIPTVMPYLTQVVQGAVGA